jgi:hypothetical protein
LRIGRRFVGIAAAAIAFAGCSTVIKTSGSDDQAYAAERAALAEAAGRLAASPWPKPSSSSLADRLAGAEPRGEKISRDDAVEAYVGALRVGENSKIALEGDAARHLDAARALKVAAEVACDSASPRLSDVALMEDAIADLRETRSIYVSSLKKLDADKGAIDRLKTDFDAAIRELAAAADALAEVAMKRQSKNFAGSSGEEAQSGAL